MAELPPITLVGEHGEVDPVVQKMLYPSVERLPRSQNLPCSAFLETSGQASPLSFHGSRAVDINCSIPSPQLSGFLNLSQSRCHGLLRDIDMIDDICVTNQSCGSKNCSGYNPESTRDYSPISSGEAQHAGFQLEAMEDECEGVGDALSMCFPEDMMENSCKVIGNSASTTLPFAQGTKMNLSSARFLETDMEHVTSCRSPCLFRSQTAPALLRGNRIHGYRAVDFGVETPPSLATPMSIVSQAFIGLMIYLAVGIFVYILRGHEFSGVVTNGFFDALYFCIVSLCTIGYGDITPVTPSAKLFSCVFVLVGFGLVDIFLSGMVSYILQRQETLLLNSVAAGPSETAKNYLVDRKKGRMRIRSKVVLAFAVMILCVGIGALMMRLFESLDWIDAFYLSCMSVTTVGYGDHAFKTLSGRMFASIWLLVSTLAVAQSFLYLAAARMDKRHRVIAKWVLEREMTLGDLQAADIDNDGEVSKSDFVVYKLKEMGKITAQDVMEIHDQFSKLDLECSGKITPTCLINLHNASQSNFIQQ